MIFDGLTVSGLRRYKCEKCNKFTYTNYKAFHCAYCGHWEPPAQNVSYKETLSSFTEEQKEAFRVVMHDKEII